MKTNLSQWEILALEEAVRARLPFLEPTSGQALLDKIVAATEIVVLNPKVRA